VHVVAERFMDLTSELRRLREGDLLLPESNGIKASGPDLPLLKSRDFH
jgi:hypothetical protein